MRKSRVKELYNLYKHCLLDDVIPFWMKNSLDKKYGGYLHFLDRKGKVFGTDKAMWLECRETWLFSKIYNIIEPKREWLEASKIGYEFITEHGFDADGRMFFLVTRDGKPLRKRRYLFTECFGVMAMTEYYKASGNKEALKRARETYRLIIDLYKKPGSLPPKIIPETRVMKSLAMPMMLICISQEIREVDRNPLYREVIDEALREILNHFMKGDLRILLDNVGANGEAMLNIPEGRLVCPGHNIEVAWFLVHEGLSRNDHALIDTGLKIIDWALEIGWDRMYGGLYYFVDVKGKPLTMLEWDMKLWWPHTEALYALLLAHQITGEEKYLIWYEKVHEWAFNHFPDSIYGEWYGYLHRDGTISTTLKGSMWKGPFHLPRALLQGMKILENMM